MFFIARRYLFSKKSTHAINVISLISVIGVAVATTAMVVVLSAFNGFSDLVASFFTSFDPQLKVVPALGKTVAADDPVLTRLRQLPEVEVATECVEDQALAVYRDKQAMVTVKGVDDNFDKLTNIGDILYGDGSFEFHRGNLQYGIIGDSLLSPGVVFQVKQAKYDGHYILTSIDFARQLLGRQGELSSLELRLKAGEDISRVKKQMQQIAGQRFKVMDRYEQQADTFKIMQIEKFFSYAFLSFILIVASFNIIGSLSMLIIDKKDDIATLRNLGASPRQTRSIFLTEGRMIATAGAVTGILLGLLLCWLQQQFGFVRLGESSGSFVVEAYPISVHPADIVLIFLTVVAVGWIAVWYPVRLMSNKHSRNT